MIAFGVVTAYTLASLAYILSLFFRTRPWILLAQVLFSISVACHFLLILSLATRLNTIPLVSPAQGVNMVIFLASAVFLVLAWRKRTASLAVFFLPPATFVLALLMPSLAQRSDIFLNSYQYWYPLHTLSVIGGEALFVVAFITSLVYLVHERIIYKGTIHSPVAGLPPLSILDSLLYACLSLGFVAITIGMILGGLWASSIDLRLSSIAPKIMAGALMWVVFAFCLHQRFAIGWRGRRTAIITLVGFCVMLVVFLVMNLAFPHAHGIGLL